MSRVGNSAIAIPSDVTVSQEGGMVIVKGKNGELSAPLHRDVELSVADNMATVAPRRDSKQAKALWGTMRATVNNMVAGVTNGFTRKLEINGVGYRAAMQGNKLVLSLGFSHPVEMEVPAGLKVSVENNTQVLIAGADKQLIGQFASEVRSKRPPEPFKGKGVNMLTNISSAKKVRRSRDRSCLHQKNSLSVVERGTGQPCASMLAVVHVFPYIARHSISTHRSLMTRQALHLHLHQRWTRILKRSAPRPPIHLPRQRLVNW